MAVTTPHVCVCVSPPPRIHYPLPLPYAGRPDPATLRRLVRELREELTQLRARRGEDGRDAEIRRLRDE